MKLEQNELTAQIVLEYERVISDFVNIVREAQQAAAAITETFNAAFEKINRSIERATGNVRTLGRVTGTSSQQWSKINAGVLTFVELSRMACLEILKLANPIELVVGGFKGLLSVLSDVIVTIGRIRVTINTLFKGVWSVLKAPFTLIARSLEFVRTGVEKVFKAFEWFQYQLFMQFMNVWLMLKVFGPLLSSFMEYNREIYNAWSLINDEMEETSYRLNVMGEELTSIVDIMHQAGLSLAVKFGEAPLNVAKAFYDALSAGIAVSDVFYTVEQAMKAARAGVTSVDVALKGGIQAMYAFGLTAGHLTEIFDAQFEAVKIGIIRYEELVAVMGRVYQSAASLGGKMERLKETYYSIAFLTRVGLSPEMGAFGLARLYEELANPDTIRALEELGVRAYDLRGEFRGLLPIIADLTNSLAGFSTEAQERMLTAVGFDMRAIRVLRAMVNNFAEFSRIAQQYEQEVGGAMESAYTKQIQAISFAMDKLKAAWDAFKISVVEASSDALSGFAQMATSLLNVGSLFVRQHRDVLSNFAKFATMFYTSFAVLALTAGVVRGLLTPFGLLSSVFAVLIYQAQKGTEFFEAFSERFPVLGAVVRTAAISIQQFADAFKQGRIEDIPVLFVNITKTVLDLFAQIPSIQRLREAISDFFTTLLDFIRGAESVTIPLIARKFGNILHAIGGVIKDAIVSLFNLQDFEGTVTDFVRKIFVVVYESIMEVFSGIFGVEQRMTLPDLLLEFGVILGLYIKTPEGKYKFNAEGVSKFLLTVLKIAMENVVRIFQGWEFVLLLAELKFVFSVIKFLLGGQLISTITQAMGRSGANAVMGAMLQRLGFGIRAGTAAFLVLDLVLRVIDNEFTQWMREHKIITVFVELALATTIATFATQIGRIISASIGKWFVATALPFIIKYFPTILLSGAVITAIYKLATLFGEKTQENTKKALDAVYEEFMDKVTNIEQIKSQVGGKLSVPEAATIVAYDVLEGEFDKVTVAFDVLEEELDKVEDAVKIGADLTEPAMVTYHVVDIYKEIADTVAEDMNVLRVSREETVKTTGEVLKAASEVLTPLVFPQVHELTDQVDTLSRSTNEHVQKFLETDKQLINVIRSSVDQMGASIWTMDLESAQQEIANIRAKIKELSNRFENTYKDIRKTNAQVDSTLQEMEQNLKELEEKITNVQISITGDISMFLRGLAKSMNIVLDSDLDRQAELTGDEIKRRFIERGIEIVERAFGEGLWRSIFDGFLLNVQNIMDISMGRFGEITIGAYKYEPNEAAAQRAIADLMNYAQRNFGPPFSDAMGVLLDDAFQTTIIEPMVSFIDSVREEINKISDPEKRGEIEANLKELEKTVADVQKAIAEGAGEEAQKDVSKMLELTFKTLSDTDKEKFREFGALIKKIDNMFVQYGDDFVKTMQDMLHIKAGGAEAVRTALYLLALTQPEVLQAILDTFVNGQKQILAAIEDIRNTVEDQEKQIINNVLKELLGISIEVEEIPSVPAVEWEKIAQFAMQNLSAEALKQLQQLLGIEKLNIENLALGLKRGFEKGERVVKELVQVYYSAEAVASAQKLLGNLIQKAFKGKDILRDLAMEAGLTPQDELRKAIEDFKNQFVDLYNEGNEIVVEYVDGAEAIYKELQNMIETGQLQGEELTNAVNGFKLLLQLFIGVLTRRTGRESAEDVTQAYRDTWQKWQDKIQTILKGQINFAQVFVEQILEIGFDLEAFVKGLGTTQDELLKILQAQGYAKPDESLLDAIKRQVREGNRDIIDFILGGLLKPSMDRLWSDIVAIITESGTDILLELVADMSKEDFAKELANARRQAQKLEKHNKAGAEMINRILDRIEQEAQESREGFISAVYALIAFEQSMSRIYKIQFDTVRDLENKLNETMARLEAEVDYLSEGFAEVRFTSQDVQRLIDVYGDNFKEWVDELAEEHGIAVESMVETVNALADEDKSIAEYIENLLSPIWKKEFQSSLQDAYAQYGLVLPNKIQKTKQEITDQLNEIRDLMKNMSEEDKKVFEQKLKAIQDMYEQIESIGSDTERLFKFGLLKDFITRDVEPEARKAAGEMEDIINKQKQLQDEVDRKIRDLESIKLNVEEAFNIPLEITDKVLEEVKALFTPEEWNAVWGELADYKELSGAKLQQLADVDPKAKEMLKGIIKKQATEAAQTMLQNLIGNLSSEGRRILSEALGVFTPESLQSKLQSYIKEYEELVPSGTEQRAAYNEVLYPFFTLMANAIAEGQWALANMWASIIEQLLQYIRSKSEDTAKDIQKIDYMQIREDYEELSEAISNAFELLRIALQEGFDFVIDRFGNNISELIDGFKSGVSQGYMNLINQITSIVELAVTKETTETVSEKLVTESGRKALALAQERIDSLLYVLNLTYQTGIRDLNALASNIDQLRKMLKDATESDQQRIKEELEQAKAQYRVRASEIESLQKVLSELDALAKGEITDIDNLSEETKAFLLKFGLRLREILRIESFEEAYIALKNALKTGLYGMLNNFLGDLQRAFTDVRDEMDVDEELREQLLRISRGDIPLVAAKLSEIIQRSSSNVVSRLVDQYTSDLDKLLNLSQVRGQLSESDVRETLTNLLESWRTSFGGILSETTLAQIRELIDTFIAAGRFDVQAVKQFVSTLRGLVRTSLQDWIKNNFDAIRQALETGDLSSLTDTQKKFLLVLFQVYGEKIDEWVSETHDALEGINFRGIFDPAALFGMLDDTIGQIDMDFVQWLRDLQVEGTSKVDYIMESLSGAIDVLYVQLLDDLAGIQKKYVKGTEEWVNALQSLSETYGVQILDPQTKQIKELSKAEFIAAIRAHIEELLELLSTEGEITETQLIKMGSWVIPLLKLLQAIFGELARASQDVAEMLEDLDFDRFISELRTTAFDVQDMKQGLEQLFTEINDVDLVSMIEEYANTAIEVMVQQIMRNIQNLQEHYEKDTTEFRRELARLSQDYGVDLVSLFEQYGADRELLQRELKTRFEAEWLQLKELLEKGDEKAILEYLAEHREFALFIIDVYRRYKEQLEEAEQELQKQQQTVEDAITGFLDAFTNLLTVLGEAFPTIQDSTDKIVQAIDIIVNTITRIMELQKVAQAALAAQETMGAFATFAYGLSTGGAILFAIAGIIQLINLFTQSQEQESEAIREHLNALERNTVALEALTDILSRMQATLYNAPSEFGYAFVPATAGATPVSSPSMTSTVMVNINVNGANITDSDVNKITHAVEAAIRRVY